MAKFALKIGTDITKAENVSRFFHLLLVPEDDENYTADVTGMFSIRELEHDTNENTFFLVIAGALEIRRHAEILEARKHIEELLTEIHASMTNASKQHMRDYLTANSVMVVADFLPAPYLSRLMSKAEIQAAGWREIPIEI